MDHILEKLLSATPKIIAAAAKNYLSLAALGIIVVGVVVCLYVRSPSQSVGADAVVMGNVPSTMNVGNGSVVIGADAHGNTILNQPMAVGRGAQAGPGSIAIGAGAGAGMSGNAP